MADDTPPREVGFHASAAELSAASRPAAHSWEPMAVGYLKRGRSSWPLPAGWTTC